MDNKTDQEFYEDKEDGIRSKNSSENGSDPKIHHTDSEHSIGKHLKKVPSLIQMEKDKIVKELTHQAYYDPYNTTSALGIIFSTILYLVDYLSDIFVAVKLKSDHNNDIENTQWWFVLTLILIIVPLVIANIFSIIWFHQDHNLQRKGKFPGMKTNVVSTGEKVFLIICHILLLGPLIRVGYIISSGIKEKSHRSKTASTNIQGTFCINEHIESKQINYYMLRKYYERDSAYLGVIDAFIQDAPQLVLQLYILSIRETHVESSAAGFQIASVLTSLISISWTMVSFEIANRWSKPEKPNASPCGNFLQFVWRFCAFISRVFTLASFATIYPVGIFLFGAGHWIFMALWTMMMGTNFCGSADDKRRPFGEFIYNIVIGWVLIFDIIHVKEGPMRIKQTFYYIIIAIEMVILLVAWDIQITKEGSAGASYVHEDWYRITLLTATPIVFITGLFFMIIYYISFHPSGRMPDKNQKASLI